MLAIVTGMIATYPVGGVAWDYGQYILGLQNLGFEVLYLEDTGGPTYDPRRGQYGDEPEYGIQFLADALTALSPDLADRWHFRDVDGHPHGIGFEELTELVNRANVFINVSGSCLLRDDYMPAKNKILIDTDPGWNHFVNYPKWDREPGWQNSHGYRAHDHFFTYAERMGSSGCRLPTLDIEWIATRPPVVLDCWNLSEGGEKWTTVMTWNNFRRPVEHEGVQYGTKELEFSKIESLPTMVSAKLEIAVGGADPPREHWRELGWSVIESEQISATPEAYRQYIRSSRGELSVAKNLYVATGSGWFSCRSACYLAAGLPVVVQETGFSKTIPVGEGLLSFTTSDEAACAINAVESDYRHHQNAARDIAAHYLDAKTVIGEMLEKAGL